MDPLAENEIRVRMAKLSGKILDRFSYFMIAKKHKDMFIDYFKAGLIDKVQEVKLGLVFNLPCFYFTFSSSEESTCKWFEQVYFDLCKD